MLITNNRIISRGIGEANGINRRGFAAFIAVILIASGVLTFSLVSISSALFYADSVNQRESRVQARLNADACLETAALMVAKDYFMNGTTTVTSFGCNIFVANDFFGNVSLNVVADFLGVRARGERRLMINESGIIVE